MPPTMYDSDSHHYTRLVASLAKCYDTEETLLPLPFRGNVPLYYEALQPLPIYSIGCR